MTSSYRCFLWHRHYTLRWKPERADVFSKCWRAPGGCTVWDLRISAGHSVDSWGDRTIFVLPPAGAVTGQRFEMVHGGANGWMEVAYTYNTAGQGVSTTLPTGSLRFNDNNVQLDYGVPVTYTTAYDSMARECPVGNSGERQPGLHHKPWKRISPSVPEFGHRYEQSDTPFCSFFFARVPAGAKQGGCFRKCVRSSRGCPTPEWRV